MRTVYVLAAALAAVGLAAGLARARDPKSELRQDLGDDRVVGDWIYDDIDAGLARAVREKKPLCVVFR